LVDADCPFPNVCGANRKCHDVCRSNADCEGDHAVCDVGSGECVECLANTDCGAAAPFCVLDKCSQCGVNADCKDPLVPICKDDHCVVCGDDADCKDPAAPICKGDVCVQCNKDKDCKDPALSKCAGGLCVAP
jgi:hypothetical protein